MKFKKSLVIICLIVCLFAISAVNAEDISGIQTDTVDLEIDDVQAIESENMETLSEGNDAGTFTDLKNNISAAGNNTIITLDRNYEDDGTGYIGFSNSNLTIDGRGHTIDAKKQTKIFIVRGSNVTIKNITFTNSQDTAIGWYGADGKITDCNFINNTAGANGGAIYWGASGGSVSGCSFIGNTAWSTGGAIFWFGGSGSVSGCSFINNTATSGGGGAIYWFDESGSVSGCSFINNTAKLGGAIYWNGDGGSVSGCSFIGNTAHRGGAISIPASRYLPANYCWFGNDASNYKDPLPISGQVNCTYRLFLNSTINPDNIPLFESSDIIFKLYLYNSSSGDISDYDNGLFKNLNLTITPENGIVDKSITKLNDTITYTGTGAGMNTITASIEKHVVATVNVDVDKGNLTLVASSSPINYGENAIIVVTGFANATGEVHARVGDGIYIEKVKDGVVTFTVPGVITNTLAEIKYLGDDNYNNATTSIMIIVNPRTPTSIESSSVSAVYNEAGYLVATLKDEEGNPVSGVKLTVRLSNGKTFTPTSDANGQVKISTKGLAPNKYSAAITFDGNNKYDKSSKEVQITVKKATPKLTAKKKTFKSTVKTKKYTVTLKDNLGKAIKKAKVTLKVNGKTYKATTNSKGKATFKITKLTKKGTYKATVTYKGNKYYTKATKKVKITIKPAFKTVSKGSKDKATVREIQQALKDKGYYLSYKGHYLMVDGKFESCTERSVKEFQHDKGLKVTGKVDEKTAKKLGII